MIELSRKGKGIPNSSAAESKENSWKTEQQTRAYIDAQPECKQPRDAYTSHVYTLLSR